MVVVVIVNILFGCLLVFYSDLSKSIVSQCSNSYHPVQQPGVGTNLYPRILSRPVELPLCVPPTCGQHRLEHEIHPLFLTAVQNLSRAVKCHCAEKQ
jgi:hypothetical protein